MGNKSSTQFIDCMQERPLFRRFFATFALVGLAGILAHRHLPSLPREDGSVACLEQGELRAPFAHVSLRP